RPLQRAGPTSRALRVRARAAPGRRASLLRARRLGAPPGGKAPGGVGRHDLAPALRRLPDEPRHHGGDPGRRLRVPGVRAPLLRTDPPVDPGGAAHPGACSPGLTVDGTAGRDLLYRYSI